MPTTHLPEITTPFALVHNSKVDYRLLFPMFSAAYIKYMREDGKVKNKWASRSLKCIVVGTCPKSDGLLFYHPGSKQIITCGNGYKFDTFSPAGPQFNEKFDGGFVFSTQQIHNSIHRPPTHELNSTVFHRDPLDKTYHKANVISLPVEEDKEPYTIQLCTSGSIIQCPSDQISDHDPTIMPTEVPNNLQFPHLPWIKPLAKVTLFLDDRMQEPKQGILQFIDHTWTFHQGRKSGKIKIPLPEFDRLAESLVNNKKLFQGWRTKASVINSRKVRATSNIIANLIRCRKISARDLHLMEAPTLLKHHQLHPDDRSTWDAAYKSEYDGLTNIETWETISDEEYQNMKHLYKGIMPTMAIATIKYDGDGKPIRAKYRIVALGNLDHHAWTKQDCFAPVLSQMELRFLIALAAKQKCIPKTGDVTQAFCQSCLPDDEHYVCRPPPGCKLTPPDTYWRLKKTLYGLKRSPRHFYVLAKSILEKVGLTQHPTSPCIFYGSLIPGQPPIYLGLYVDDFVYFSESSAVEQLFEKRFGNEISTDFNGRIGYFLGINFSTIQHDNGNISIHLSQEAFIENLVQLAQLDDEAVNTAVTPYRSGYPVDAIPTPPSSSSEYAKNTHLMQVLVGCLTWLSISTRPDIATITNMLAKYTTKATKSHLQHVKRVIKYLKGTKTLGICFDTETASKVEAFVKFPLPNDKITSLCDANWGPQDQSRPRDNESRQIDIFKSRSISGYILYLGGPLHWVSKRQTITARSSAEAEIYATDECTKCLLHLHQIIDGLNLKQVLMHNPNPIYNDNSACVNWSHNMTTKGLRHIQIRENSIRESIQKDFISVSHIPGKLNLSDMFTKEDKSPQHFVTIRDIVMTDKHDLSRHDHTFSGSSLGGCQVGTSQLRSQHQTNNLVITQ